MGHERIFWPVVACVTAGFAVTGAVTGLLVGFAAYPPTAVFAALELGLPVTIGGFVVALLVGAVVRYAAGLRPR